MEIRWRQSARNPEWLAAPLEMSFSFFYPKLESCPTFQEVPTKYCTIQVLLNFCGFLRVKIFNGVLYTLEKCSISGSVCHMSKIRSLNLLSCEH